MITATIVDDEPLCCEALSTLLERYCPTVKVLDICYSASGALKSIGGNPPQILFLDIEMPFMNGFQLLEKLPCINFHIIFTTSYNHYAIKAIKFSALDYLMKPIERVDLQKAVQKALHTMPASNGYQIETLLNKLNHPSAIINRIAIPTVDGLHMIYVDSVIACSADSNYTVLLLKDKRKIVASRTLKDMEEILDDYPFARVHHSFIVNLNEVEKYVRGEGGYLIMSDGTTVDVSRNRKDLLLKKLRPGKS